MNRRSERRRPTPPPLFSRSEWARLSSLVVLFALAAVGFYRLQDPSISIPFAEAGPDVRLEIDDPNAVQIVAASGPRAEPQADNDSPPPKILPAGDADDQGKPADFNPLKLMQTNECNEVNRALLDAVVRDKLPARSEEREAIYQVLCVAATMPPDKLAKLARTDVTFADLYNDPAVYRGTPVHIRGLLRRLERNDVKDDRNPHGFSKYYEGWVFPDDQSEYPTRILFSEIPDELAPSEDLAVEIETNAFFFKLIGYRAVDGKARVAPMLVGFRPQIVTLDGSVGRGTIVIVGLFATLALVVAVLWFWQNRRDRNVEARIRPHTTEAGGSPPVFTDGDLSDGGDREQNG